MAGGSPVGEPAAEHQMYNGTDHTNHSGTGKVALTMYIIVYVAACVTGVSITDYA